MAFKKHNPGCPCCCCDCDAQITDENEDDNLSDYDQVAGSWTYNAGNGAYETTNSDSLLIHNTEVDPATANNAILAVLTTCVGTNTSAFRVICSYADSDNYLFVEVIRSDSLTYSLTLNERIGGVETELDSGSQTLSADAPVIKLGHYEGTVTAYWENGSVPVRNVARYLEGTVSDPSALGAKWGVGCGTITGGDTVGIWPWEFFRTCVECNNQGCEEVEWETWPTSIQIEFSGVAANSCSPADCDEYNTTTYILSRAFGGTICSWGVSGVLPDCHANSAGDSISVSLGASGTDNVKRLRVNVNHALAGTKATGFIDITAICERVDGVADINGLSVPLTDSGHPNCDFSNATATVTAIA